VVLRRELSSSGPLSAGSSVRHWQFVLLLDQLRGQALTGATTSHAGSAGFLTKVRRRHGSAELLELCSDRFDPRGGGELTTSWLGLRDGLVRRTDGQAVSALTELAGSWRRQPSLPFEWVAEPPPPQALAFSTATTGGGTHAAVLVLRDAIRQRELSAEQRFSTTWLAGRLSIPPSSARQVLARLQEDGVIRRLHDRGFAVISPRREDVLEVYAARRALGSMLVGHATTTATSLDRSRAALEVLRLAATAPDSHDRGDADLDFQDALASDSGAGRLVAMFHRLSDQLRLFVAALGVRYWYAPKASLADDEAVLGAVERREPDAAIRAWQAKMARAAGYMLHQLPDI
jgi:DNA-binding GntR family transcriptional regulator